MRLPQFSLSLIALLAGSLAQVQQSPAQQSPADAASAPLEEVLVSGEHPGPGLWKVSKNGHTLWILGTHTPLPKKLHWRSQLVESVISESNEILGPYSVSLNVRDSDALHTKHDDLKSLLPARAYTKWLSAKRRYIGDDQPTDRLLPASAALLLQLSAFEQAGLTHTDEVWTTIGGLAEQYRVPIALQEYLTDPVSPSGGARRSARRAGVRYLERIMERLPADIAESKARANAWAVGNVAALRELAKKNASDAELFAHAWPFLTDTQVAKLLVESDNRLLVIVDSALKRNQTTFAALPIQLLMKKGGLIENLAAIGCSVEEPQ